MKELIDEAQQLIVDKPLEAEIIYHILTEWDDEMRTAFILAYRSLKDKNEK
jgi:hypothetical protein